MNDVVVFSGHAHPALADRICEHLGVRRAPVDIKRFSNDCLQVQLLENCRQQDVYLVQPLVPPTQEHLMELLLMIDAAPRRSASQITVVMPHYAYARSDKKDAPRISIGGRLVADLLVTAGADRVLTMALHAPQVHGFFSVPVDHLTAIGVLADHYRDADLTDTVVVSPDLGNARRPPSSPGCWACPSPPAASSGSVTTGSSSTRSSATSPVGGPSSSTTRSRPAGRSSSCSSGSRTRGASRRRSPAPTGCSRPGRRAAARPPDDQRGRHDRHGPAAADWPELRIRSVDRLFAEAISRIHQGRSVSSLFEGVDPTHAPPQRACRSEPRAPVRPEVVSSRTDRVTAPRPTSRRTTPVAVAALLDVVVVLVFAAVGRASHGEQDAVTGVLAVAWPFLAARRWAGRPSRLRGRWPLTVRWDGVVVWASTLVLGMVLRVVTGAGTAASFVRRGGGLPRADAARLAPRGAGGHQPTALSTALVIGRPSGPSPPRRAAGGS